MVLRGTDTRDGEYSLRMLEGNQVSCFLPLKRATLNAETALMYEVTSLQTLERSFERAAMSEKDIRLLLRGLSEAMKEGRRYLLTAPDIVLDPAYIFLDPDRSKVQFVYLPGYGEEEGRPLMLLADFMLKHLDHKDSMAVELGYHFYDECSDANSSLQRVLEDVTALLNERRIENARMGENGDKERCGYPGYDPPVFSGALEKAEPAGGQGLRDGGREQKEQGREGSSRRKKQAGRKKDAVTFHIGRGKDAEGGMESKVRRSRGGTTGREGSKGGEGRRWEKIAAFLPAAGAGLVLGVIFAVIVWLGKLDLTQTGGLFFGMVALVWLIYSLTVGKRKKHRGVWADELEDTKDEEEFLEALMSEVYNLPPGRRIPAAEGSGYSGYLDNGSFAGEAEDKDRGRQRQSGRGGWKEENADAEYTGYTRALSSVHTDRKLMLVSEDIRRCRDLTVESTTALVGKKQDQVDLCIPLDVVSRIHAKISQDGDAVVITDLNSRNGTYINEKELQPGQEYPLKEGDTVRFATARFEVRYR